jgi:hypothetical protein
VGIITSIRVRLLCWNHDLCLTEMHIEHTEEDVLIKHRHPKPSVRSESAHQDVRQPRASHTTLLWRSPTSFRNCAPVSLLLNRNVRNSLLATPSWPRTAHPYGMGRMKGVVSSSCCRYVTLTLLTPSAIASLHLHLHTQIDLCKLVLQAAGTDTVSSINMWLPQHFPLTETQVLNKMGRGEGHDKKHWPFLYPTGFSTFHGIMECKRRKYVYMILYKNK